MNDNYKNRNNKNVSRKNMSNGLLEQTCKVGAIKNKLLSVWLDKMCA